MNVQGWAHSVKGLGARGQRCPAPSTAHGSDRFTDNQVDVVNRMEEREYQSMEFGAQASVARLAEHLSTLV